MPVPLSFRGDDPDHASGRSSSDSAPFLSGPHAPNQRIDKYLWFVRLTKSRSIAQNMAQRGIIRLNGRRIDRAHSPVRVGDLLTLPQGDRIIVIRILQLPHRRGPASEAQNCYEELKLGA
ncbi:MAG: RNA-binding S4 domain-containing protein [Sphingobium sp.]|nr:RNA-binding S4 domain-containing protein [Sphingobium sp.]